MIPFPAGDFSSNICHLSCCNLDKIMDRTQEILKLFDEGCRQEEIKRRAKIGWSTLNKIIKQAGRNFYQRNGTKTSPQPSSTKTRTVPPRKVKTDSSRKRAAEKKVLRKISTQKIQKSAGINDKSVEKTVSKAGKKFIQRKTAATEESRVSAYQKRMILRLHSEGWGQREIAKRTGLTRHVVRRQLTLAGKTSDKPRQARSGKVEKLQGNEPVSGQHGRLATFDDFFGGNFHLENIAQNTGVSLDAVRRTLFGTEKEPCEGKEQAAGSPPPDQPVQVSEAPAAVETTDSPSTDRTQKIIKMFDDGCTRNEIVHSVKIGNIALRKILQKAGRSFSQRTLQKAGPRFSQQTRRNGRPVTAEQREQIVRLFDEGRTRDEISRIVNVGTDLLRKTLKQAGKSFAERNGRLVSVEQKEQILRQFDEGRTRNEIARSAKIGTDLLRKTLQQAGKSFSQRNDRCITAEEKEEILRWFDEGRTRDEISRSMKVSTELLRKTLQQAGKYFSQRKVKREIIPANLIPVTNEHKEQILQLFEEGCSVRQIMQRTGVHFSGVRRSVAEAGKNFTERNRVALWESRCTEEQKETLCQMYDEGNSRKEMGKRLGLTGHAVEKELAIAGKIVHPSQHVLDKVLRNKTMSGDASTSADMSREHTVRTRGITIKSPGIQDDFSDASVEQLDKITAQNEEKAIAVEEEQSATAENSLVSFDNCFGGAYNLSSLAQDSGIPIDTARRVLLSGTTEEQTEDENGVSDGKTDDCVQMSGK